MPKTMRLPVALTDAEMLELGTRISKELDALAAVKAEKREAVSGFNAEIKGHEGTVATLNEALKKREEIREVEVRDEKDPVAGIMRVIRCDTNEEVNLRSIDPDERQVALGLDGPTIGSAPADASDEQRDAATPEEAEAMRNERLEREHEERVTAVIDGLKPAFTVRAGETDKGEDAFVATVSHAGVSYAADGETEQEARDGLVEALIEVLDDAALVAAKPMALAYSAEVVAFADEMAPRVVVSSEDDLDGKAFYSAKVETPAWVSEAFGDTEAQARQTLREKLLAQFAAERGETPTAEPADADPLPSWADVQGASAENARRLEIERLAVEQAEDSAKTKKALLKVPSRGPKPRTSTSTKGKGITVVDEGGAVLARGRDGVEITGQDGVTVEESDLVEDVPTDADGRPVAF
jgi:hypothetical protein